MKSSNALALGQKPGHQRQLFQGSTAVNQQTYLQDIQSSLQACFVDDIHRRLGMICSFCTSVSTVSHSCLKPSSDTGDIFPIIDALSFDLA